ncbi:MAG: metallophosphoesterase family protein [Gemmiger sp.]|uniref:metallophosphoesterase family protein n=1 Tax=Gemmiger sp. TaxID=2049027 RepID=UPI002843C0B6|nr:metallophosphoesterase family protein [Gemmiger sp.]MDR3851340.1 metallophosphoesterase family protein [Gemmiger sp.]
MAEQPIKVLVVSDVHGRVTPLRWLLKNETADALFFLGDGLYDLDQAIAANGAAPDYPIYRVRGNCDIGFDDPAEGLAPFGGVLFFYTHGHLFGVKSGYERIAEYAADRGADVVLFGHTHYKTLRHGTPFSPALFNPGSLRDTHSYGVITITDGQCSFEWKQVPEQW